MQVVFHVGMGKTGTTSLQSVLGRNVENLRAQKVEYLGSWFEMLDPPIAKPEHLSRFRTEPAGKIKKYGKQFAEYARAHSEKHGTKLFILSNEGLAGYSRSFPPFASAVGSVAQVRIIAYARNVWTWLPSAYAQWGMRHKTHSEKIRSFKEQSSDLVRTYMQPVNWSRYLGKRFELRSYDATDDVVQDFADAVGIKLPRDNSRQLERSDESELLLRALYNNLYNEPVGVANFNNSVLRAPRSVATLEQNIKRYFDYSAMDAAIDEHEKIFSRIKRRFDLDLAAEPAKRPEPPSPEEMRERLFDLLMHITLSQSKKLEDLEKEILALRNEFSNKR